jgi:hypothetical protein
MKKFTLGSQLNIGSRFRGINIQPFRVHGFRGINVQPFRVHGFRGSKVVRPNTLLP